MRNLLLATVVVSLLAGLTLWLVFGRGEDPLAKGAGAAVASLKTRAAKGEVEAQFALGRMHVYGDQVEQDFLAAANWYLRAADKGHTEAQYELGRMYELGMGVKQSYTKAAEWYRLAGTIGRHPRAQFALGQFYAAGRGVPNDYGEALDWYRKAALQGHAAAQYLLGSMYEEGWGVERDLIEAYKWYTLSARSAGEALAVNPTFDPDKALATLKLRMNQYQLGEAERRIKVWRPGS